MEEITIGEVARRTGIAASALRYYEAAGVLPAVRRRNGRRFYDAEVVNLIEVVKFAQSVGFSLAEVRELSRGFGNRARLRARWRPLAMAKLRELDRFIEQARRMKFAIEQGLACGCIRIEDCLGPAPPVTEVSPKLPRVAVIPTGENKR